MTEKEKMLAGLLYDPGIHLLANDRLYAQDLCFQINQLSPLAEKQRYQLFQTLLGKTGEQFTIMPGFQCDYGYNIEIGENFFANFNCIMLDAAKITFGDNVLVAPNCGFYTSGHPLDSQTRCRGLEFAKPITIGHNVWIGGNVIILPNVTIGDNTVIAAGSIVDRDIPSNVVAMGAPCREYKTL
ncbi:sugar O-acetyltransferase [Gilliamella sp. B2717]|uniref:sugar O-acetyltransferase n=1 Tax=unclassified Gilliamella TaxID=2685620 RepID=UPI002269B2E4|nr:MULTISPECIES: sugar O-acetyltransferase [unclassified Gilliamella]MCX8574378.1 sugar O-acetyltransferase [Gilliamella sp. B3831]MCX8576609.1 sugar O-acetyltransferase [Gilliamella sp. B3815]MCX8578049.1 sugar O-acetyltransferase [Gilliamella sp. B2717]MCX8590821.1 sugar O-acetyltransferase [Gilliamella sp. B3812]MCX8603504.1 sugar O-acetyltransferase [Gilliamella sp. B3823]